VLCQVLTCRLMLLLLYNETQHTYRPFSL